MRSSTPFLLSLALFFPTFANPADPPWTRLVLQAGERRLAAAVAPNARGEVLTVVIEGDGRSHDGSGRPTADPTPKTAVGLRIAEAWPDDAVAWLARPCQYVAAEDPHCAPADWTDGRFSAEAVAATNAALDALKSRTGTQRIRLVGWSGGGVMAVLAAQTRSDVAGLVTFAAPLDLAAWSRRHRLTPLWQSLDPAARRFQAVTPQVHYLGSLDGNVPPAVARAAAMRLSEGRGVVRVFPERHDCCWERRAAAAREDLRALELSPEARRSFVH